MTDLIEKVRQARPYYPTGGDDWGYVIDPTGANVSGELGSWKAAWRASDEMNAKAAITTVLKEMMEPNNRMVGAARGATPAYGQEGVKWPWRKKTKSRWQAMLREFAQQHNIELGEEDG